MRQIVRQEKKGKKKKKLVPYRQCQGHNEGLYSQNMTISTMSSTTKLGLIIQHYKPECPAEKLDYCAQGQGHTEG